jgi:hypothetical protein
MTVWFHSTILATSLLATIAVGVAGASIITDGMEPAAPKADRLPVTAAATMEYVTTETRIDGTSILTRTQVDPATLTN